ncbi:MAG: type II secretion system F family protein [Candidatus Altiarchaeota archaeon]
MRIYAMLLPQHVAKDFGRRFQSLGKFLADFTPELKSDMVLADIDMTAEEYLVSSLLSAFILGLIMFVCTYVPLAAFDVADGNELILSIGPSLVLLLLDFAILVVYPRILVVKRAEIIEKDLVYALKDLLLNISAGLTLFESIKRVSEAGHGIVSEDLKMVVKSTNRGMALDDVLEELALRTPSEYMRSALWQIVNAVKAGTSIKDALSGIIDSLMREQNRRIRDYIQELNVMTLIYMLFAVAVPTIVSTLLVILTSLMGTGVSEDTYFLVVVVCICVQIMLVGLIRSRRPVVYSA